MQGRGERAAGRGADTTCLAAPPPSLCLCLCLCLAPRGAAHWVVRASARGSTRRRCRVMKGCCFFSPCAASFLSCIPVRLPLLCFALLCCIIAYCIFYTLDMHRARDTYCIFGSKPLCRGTEQNLSSTQPRRRHNLYFSAVESSSTRFYQRTIRLQRAPFNEECENPLFREGFRWYVAIRGIVDFFRLAVQLSLHAKLYT